MKDIMNEIDAAFALVSTLPVSGDNVEIMATVREHLRRAYKMAKDADTTEGENG